MSPIRKLTVLTVAFAAAAASLPDSSAEAGSYYGYRSSYSDSSHSCAPRYYYKTITTWNTVTKPYTVCRTKYYCGKAYHAMQTFYKTIRIPVTHRVRVSY